VEFNIFSQNVKWEFFAEGEVLITSASNESDKYEITNGEFVFSPKSCEGLTAPDFGKPVQLRFTAGKARMPFEMKGCNAPEWCLSKGNTSRVRPAQASISRIASQECFFWA
jgi:hypothetical protein